MKMETFTVMSQIYVLPYIKITHSKNAVVKLIF